ncbi:GTP-binding protein [Bacillus sp. F19]|nr:GTP-binding protein [Bacillus sp. F19]
MKKVSVYVINGFLGSGKTTMLLKLVEQYKKENKKVAIILNELGAVHVEGHLFKGQQLIELLNGCICCTIQNDLHLTLQSLIIQHESEPIDVLLIEGTGVAHPLEIAEVFTPASMKKVFDLKSIIGIVDASHFLNYLSIFSSSKEIRTLMKEQVLHSSIVLLNKIDCVDDVLLPKIHKKVDSLKKNEVPVLMTSYGATDFSEIRKDRFEPKNSRPPTTANDHHHEHESHHSTIKTIKMEKVPMMDKQLLTKWLNNLPKDVIRVKGLVQFKGDSHLTHIQYADKLVRYTSTEKSDQRQPILVLIGKDLTKDLFLSFPNDF